MNLHACKGLTLLELTIALAILALIAVIALPSSAPAKKYKLEAAAQQFADAIRFARSEAVRTGSWYGYYFRGDQKIISVYRADTGTNPWTPIYDVYHPVTKQLYTIDLTNDPVASVDLITGSANYQSSTCTDSNYTNFSNNGIAYCNNPNNLLLTDGTIIFNLNGDTREITLNGFNGRVSVK